MKNFLTKKKLLVPALLISIIIIIILSIIFKESNIKLINNNKITNNENKIEDKTSINNEFNQENEMIEKQDNNNNNNNSNQIINNNFIASEVNNYIWNGTYKNEYNYIKLSQTSLDKVLFTIIGPGSYYEKNIEIINNKLVYEKVIFKNTEKIKIVLNDNQLIVEANDTNQEGILNFISGTYIKEN